MHLIQIKTVHFYTLYLILKQNNLVFITRYVFIKFCWVQRYRPTFSWLNVSIIFGFFWIYSHIENLASNEIPVGFCQLIVVFTILASFRFAPSSFVPFKLAPSRLAFFKFVLERSASSKSAFWSCAFSRLSQFKWTVKVSSRDIAYPIILFFPVKWYKTLWSFFLKTISRQFKDMPLESSCKYYQQGARFSQIMPASENHGIFMVTRKT